ncbi:MAG: biopolymer transport protein TolR [Pseudohongiellaceae bacterium]|jgi:biopolymer transport protein TolR
MSYNMSPNKKMKKKPMAEINVVPYIDVMLVLLVIFMVTAPLLNQGVKVDLPQAASAPIDNADLEPLIVSIKADGSYFVKLGKDEELAKPLDLIAGQVAKIVKLKPETQILVWGDTSVAYGKVVDLMSRLTQAGAQSVGLVTEPPR